MTSELTSDQERLLKTVFDSLPVIHDLGLELDVHDNFGDDVKVVETPAPGDKLAVWLKFNTKVNFEEHPGFDEVRDFVVDGASRVPKYSFRYINPGIKIFDGLNPSNCRRYTYGVEEAHYPWSDVAEIPFMVSRQVVEVLDVIPDGDKLGLGKRTNVLVNRLIYQNAPRSGDIFAPFSLVSSSVFQRAPGNYRKGLIDTQGEWWLEKTRIFRFKKEEIVYKRTLAGIMEKYVKAGFVYSEVDKFLRTLGSTDEIFFPGVELVLGLSGGSPEHD